MNKKTLYKLIKLALFETLKEKHGGVLKGSYENLEKITLLERIELNEQIAIKEAKERLIKEVILQEERTKEFAKKIYDFLRKAKKKRIPFDELREKYLFQTSKEEGFDVNMDGLEIVYEKIGELTFEDFEILLPDFTGVSTNVCSCASTGTNNCPSYGATQVYTNSCQPQLQAIDDRFVCCSAMNPYTDDTSLPLTIYLPNGTAAISIAAGANVCIEPTDLELYNASTNTQPNITYDDLNDFVIATGDANGLLGNNQWQTSFYSGISTGTNSGPDCGGCARPGSTNYDPSALGCFDASGNADPQNLDCCQFSGCGAKNTLPPANNVTTVAAATNQNGVQFAAFDLNEAEAWVTDDGTCAWDPTCTQGTILINGVSYTTVQGGNGTAYTNVTAGYPSNYIPGGSNPITLVDDGSCNILACTNTNIANPQDPSGNSLITTYVGPAGPVTNPQGDTLYTLTSDDANECFVTGCNEPLDANGNPNLNYIDTNTFGGTYQVINDSGLCVGTIDGCNVIGYTNYNPQANTSDNTCYYQGCTNQATGGTSVDYVCTLHPFMCLDSTGQATCDDTIHDTTLCVPNTNLPEVQDANFDTLGNPLTTPFPHVQGNCSGIGGCTDNGTNQDQSWWTTVLTVGAHAGSAYSTLTGEQTYGALGAPNNTDVNATLEDGSCNWNVNGCTGVIVGNNGITYNIPPAILGNLQTNTSHLTYIEDGSCQITYCMVPTALNYFCNDYPGLCVDLGAGDQPDLNLIQPVNPDNPSCQYAQVDGCMDNITTGGQTYTTNTGATYTNTANPNNTQVGACNYMPSANNDDGTHCTYPDNNCDCQNNVPSGFCDCNGTVDNGCCPSSDFPDCSGACGGSAFIDDCGICAGGNTGLTPNDHSNTGISGPNQDCAGSCEPNSPSPNPQWGNTIDQCGDCKRGLVDPAGNTQLSPDIDYDGCVGCTNLQSPDYGSNSGDPNAFSQYNGPGDLIDDNTCTFYACTDNTLNPPATNYICNDGTALNMMDAFGVIQTVYPFELCEDSNGTPLTQASSTGVPMDGTGTNDIGDFFNQGCTQPAVGCIDDGNGVYGYTSGTASYPNGEANNYNNTAGAVACDGTNSSQACLPAYVTGFVPLDPTTGNPIANPTQTITSNPDGCCCQYSPGCTDGTLNANNLPNKINYNPNANQDDGSCIDAVYGCMQPGMDNYNPAANADDGSCIIENRCFDDGSWSTGVSPSPYLDYICLDQNIIPNYTPPNTGDPVTYGEVLCDCVGFGTGTNECNGNSQFNTLYGQYVDGTVYDSGVSPILDDYTDPTLPNAIQGSCQNPVGGTDGCMVSSYTQNPGTGTLNTVTPVGYSAVFTQQLAGSCGFLGCDNPNADNYFCIDNPGLCDMTLNNGLGGVDPNIGTLNDPSVGTSPYDCEFSGVKCDPNDGCTVQFSNDINDIEYATAAECQAECTYCTEVTAERCHGNSVRNYTCNDYGKAGLNIDGFPGNPNLQGSSLPVTGEYGIGQYFEVEESIRVPRDIVAEQQKSKFPDPIVKNYDVTAVVKHPGNVMVSYKVTSISNKYVKNNNIRQADSTECFPISWDCKCYHHLSCPEFPGQGGGHMCLPNYKGTGLSATLYECLSWCPCEITGRVPTPPTAGTLNFKKLEGCSGHTGKRGDILPRECGSEKYYDKETRKPEEPIEPKDIDKVEPVDIERPDDADVIDYGVFPQTTEPTGSANVPQRPKRTPDTPEITESKKLRKLIEKWKKNNL